MAYGTIKVDQVTFTNGGIDQTISVSGIVQSISGDITATGTIQGATIIGTSTVSGATVTGDAGQFITATAATGVFTSTLSGATITGNTASFTTITGGTVTLTSGVFASGTAAAPSVSIGTTDNGLYSPGADQLAISTNGTGRVEFGTSEVVFNDGGVNYDFRIEGDTNANLFFVDASTDRVGIGVANPSEALHVKSTSTTQLLLERDGSGSNIAAILFKDGSGDENRISSSEGNLIFGAPGTTEAARIDSSGRLGLGTSSPQALGHFSNTAGSAEVRITCGGSAVSGESILRFGNVNDQTMASIRFDSTNDNLSFYSTNDTRAMTIDSSQRVGIGTTSPGEKLHISGGTDDRIVVSGSGSSGLLFENTSGTALFQIVYDDSSTDNCFITTSDDLVFRNQSGTQGGAITERVRIDSSGRLLVGTSSARTNFYYSTTGRTPGLQYESNGSDTALSVLRTDGLAAFYLANADTVADGDGIGGLNFVGNDGTNLRSFAKIEAEADGAVSTADVPGRLVFSTNPGSPATGPTEQMRIQANGTVRTEQNTVVCQTAGRLYISNTSSSNSIAPSSIGSGSTTMYIGNAAIQVSSDKRLKNNIEDTKLDALDAISRIEVKDFVWNDPTDTSHNNRNARGKWTGLIAQELVEILPFVVNAPRKELDGSIDYESDECWTLDQSQLCPVLIKAIQQQQEIISALESRLSALESN